MYFLYISGNPRIPADIPPAQLAVCESWVRWLAGRAGPVRTNRDGGLVALTNIRSALREALAGHEDLRWVTPHSFRRSVATVVRDGLGVEAAQQQLSHRQLATTEGHYVERVTSGPDTRAVLEKWASNDI